MNTSDNRLIKELLVDSNSDFKTQFETLFVGQAINKRVDEYLVFGDLAQQGGVVWSLLLMVEYLKVMVQQDTSQGVVSALDIPNLEVRRLYQQLIEQWLS